jgi:hypothetical protein
MAKAAIKTVVTLAALLIISAQSGLPETRALAWRLGLESIAAHAADFGLGRREQHWKRTGDSARYLKN